MSETDMEDRVWRLMQDIRRQYPLFPSTFSPCPSCKPGHLATRNLGRGGGECFRCLEKRLARLVGVELAAKYVVMVESLAEVEREIMDVEKQKDGDK